MKEPILILAGLIAVLLVALLALETYTMTGNRLYVAEEIFIPDGYQFVGASAYGEFANIRTFYCEQENSKRIYKCTDGVVGEEIVFPEGYHFAGASSYGRFSSITTFYCRLDGTERIFECKPMLKTGIRISSSSLSNHKARGKVNATHSQLPDHGIYDLGLSANRLD